MTVHVLNILLVEDNATIAAQLGDFLAQAGCLVDHAASGRAALRLALDGHFDVIVLDLNLPDIDGVEVCRQLKAQQRYHTPVLMLTARDSLDDKIRGLSTGADDYVTKPFALAEVAARCQVLARRHLLHTERVVRIGPLAICRQSRQVQRDGHPIALSDLDFRLLLLLVEAAPRALGRSELMARLWGEQAPDSDVLKAHMYTLRQAVDKPFGFNMIRTVHAAGYRLQATP
ncbi:response regulator transcription factor [Telluria beijingensis]|uniref:response regulator transcription factor n=1 Tax=Telluria beijingensis TaxID=3068633 RepID=UPI002795B33E|nr:response regulator transcription factor [Massilia sp. REN29]